MSHEWVTRYPAAVFTTTVRNGRWMIAFGLAPLRAEMGPPPSITGKSPRIPIAPENKPKNALACGTLPGGA